MELSIPDAAIALGVSQNTVRRRLTSGLLMGNKVGGKWLINLENVPPQRDAATNQDLVDQLKARVTAQDNELAAKNMQIDQLHQLLARGALIASTARPWWKFWGG